MRPENQAGSVDSFLRGLQQSDTGGVCGAAASGGVGGRDDAGSGGVDG